jgi:hypothetical protein
MNPYPRQDGMVDRVGQWLSMARQRVLLHAGVLK